MGNVKRLCLSCQVKSSPALSPVSQSVISRSRPALTPPPARSPAPVLVLDPQPSCEPELAVSREGTNSKCRACSLK